MLPRCIKQARRFLNHKANTPLLNFPALPFGFFTKIFYKKSRNTFDKQTCSLRFQSNNIAFHIGKIQTDTNMGSSDFGSHIPTSKTTRK